MSQHDSEPLSVQERILNEFIAASDEFFTDSIIQLLYDIDEGELPVLDFFIDEIRSDHHEEDAATAAGRINGLLKELGVDPILWSKAFIEGKAESVFSGSIVSRSEAVHDTRAGNGIGKFVTELAFDILPIEQNEDGWGNVSILLESGREYTIRLHSQGSLYMEDHAICDLDEEAEIDSNVDYTIRFLADIQVKNS